MNLCPNFRNKTLVTGGMSFPPKETTILDFLFLFLLTQHCYSSAYLFSHHTLEGKTNTKLFLLLWKSEHC